MIMSLCILDQAIALKAAREARRYRSAYKCPPAFNISSQETGKQGTGDIMQAIRRHMSEIADEVGGEIADRLSEAFANMGLEGV